MHFSADALNFIFIQFQYKTLLFFFGSGCENIGTNSCEAYSRIDGEESSGGNRSNYQHYERAETGTQLKMTPWYERSLGTTEDDACSTYEIPPVNQYSYIRTGENN